MIDVLINFDNWEVDEDSPFGSGASEKSGLLILKQNKKAYLNFLRVLIRGSLRVNIGQKNWHHN